MISILFIVRKNRLRRNGRTPIYVRITVDSVSVEFTSDREVEPEQWITARGRAKPLASKNKALNAYLDQIEIDLFNIGQAMQREGCMVTAREIMHRYKGIEQPKDFICAIYEEHNAKLKELVDKSVALNTYKRHVTSLKLFREFLMAAKGVAASDEYVLRKNPKYVNKIVAPTMEPVKSIGGFRTLPDYSFGTIPDDYAALVLIGGFGWSTPVAEQVMPTVKQSIERGKIVGAICNGASFMAKCGFLNAIRHTGNGLEQLKLWGGENYTNYDGYIHAQAISDKNIVTANGSATLEFAKEALLLLENETPERIEMYYQFNKQGFCNLFPEN